MGRIVSCGQKLQMQKETQKNKGRHRGGGVQKLRDSGEGTRIAFQHLAEQIQKRIKRERPFKKQLWNRDLRYGISELLGSDSERTLGFRHHVPLDRPRVAISRRSDGPVFQTHHRLVDESAHQPSHRSQRAQHGTRST